MAVVTDIIMAGLAGDIPAASSSNDGYLYFETDTLILKRSNGSTWVQVAASPTSGLFVKADGTVAFTGNQSLGSNKITNSADPSSAQDVATKNYVDGIAVNLGKRSRVRVATTANITIATALNNGDTLDGISLVTADLVLVKNQSAPAENGIYVVGVSPARSSEFDTYNEHPGSLIAVQEGTANEDTVWICTSNAGGTLETTAILFSSLGTGSSAVEDLTTAETDTSLVLAPDGAGGVEWVTPVGGGLDPTEVYSTAAATADDDEFDNGSIDGAFVEIAGSTGTVTWSESRHRLIAEFDDNQSQRFKALVKPLTLSDGEAVETLVAEYFSQVQNFPFVGVCLTNGVLTSSLYAYAHLYTSSSPTMILGAIYGAFNAGPSIPWSSFSITPTTPIRLRLYRTSSTVYGISYSVGGSKWILAGSTFNPGFTPSHAGFMVSTYGGTLPSVCAFEYLRKVTP